jgi:hypothetical protein
MYQQLWGYKVEEKLYLGVREQKRLNTTGIDHPHIANLVAIRWNKYLHWNFYFIYHSCSVLEMGW